MAEDGNGAVSVAGGENSGLVQELFRSWQADNESVDLAWHEYFLKNPQISVPARQAAAPLEGADPEFLRKVWALVHAHRTRGHLRAKLNPLSKGVRASPPAPELDLSSYAFTNEELETDVPCNEFQGRRKFKLKDLVKELERVYCSSVGFQFTHLTNPAEKKWMRERVEDVFGHRDWYADETRVAFLKKLTETEIFDNELHLKFPTSKRFSLRGGETVNTMLMTLLDSCFKSGIPEVVMGLSHRGRINILGNIGGQSLREIVAEFEDRDASSAVGAGDVKYHLGHSGSVETMSGGRLNLSIASNASHLEFVGPIVEGIVRAKQDGYELDKTMKAMAVVFHGDAAISGQGVAWETFNFSRLSGYSTGGTIHFVVNNQLGFTTNPEDCRSSVYCTDAAKAVEAPVFHVNSEDIEACSRVCELALEFRNRFSRDVFIDVLCYRKFGHNEGDDPSFTQPVMYSEIKSRRSLAEMYGSWLVQQGVISENEVHAIETDTLNSIRHEMESPQYMTLGEASAVYGRIRVLPSGTAVSEEDLKRAASAMIDFPEGFVPHPKIRQIMEKRVASVQPGSKIDWATAEELAFATLVTDGVNIRLSGEDCGRGTFSQRHLELHHVDREEHFYPVERLARKLGLKSRFNLFNSPLSETGVLGFEYGYGIEAQNTLVLWEAQFGDFANVAQPVIDQFIISSEAKWNVRSGVTLLLPHGYEGAGPEHSSARLERYLSLAAHGNISVCYPSTAGQYFHLLRRQGKTLIKRPLFVATPKGLLRSPEASSDFSEFTSSAFRPAISTDAGGDGTPRHLVFVSGKFYYEVQKTLAQLNVCSRIVRIEELYPFPEKEILDAVKPFRPETVSWVQEEPENMGAFRYVDRKLGDLTGTRIQYVGRPESASTACGSHKWFLKEQAGILTDLTNLITGQKRGS